SRYRPDVADRIAAAERWVDGTLAQSDLRLRTLQQRVDHGTATDRERQELERGRRAQEVHRDHFRRLLAAGVKMVSGSDSSWMWYPMGHFAEEVIAHAEWGMGASAAIVSATADAARCLDIGSLAGMIQPGKTADLLVVDADPLRDI